MNADQIAAHLQEFPPDLDAQLTWCTFASIGMDATPEQVEAINRLVDFKVGRETERCAKIAKSWEPKAGEWCDGDPGDEIADKIRSGK